MDTHSCENSAITRRAFEKNFGWKAAGTLAVATGVVTGMRTLLHSLTHHDHGDEAHTNHHADPEEIARRLAAQERHPFHRNPSQWLRDHRSAFGRAFDLSRTPVTRVKEYCVEEALRLGVQEGIRVRRTPGSTILKGREESLAAIRTCLQCFQSDGSSVRYEAFAHGDCGAGIVFARENNIEDDTDDAAEREIRERAQMLRDLGIDASFGRRIPLREMDRDAHAHNAIVGVVCPDGRFHDWRPAGLPPSFVASSHDPEELAHGVDIMLKVASGAHGYGEQLRHFRLLTLRHPDDRRLSDRAFERVREAADAVARERSIQIEHLHWNSPLAS